MKFTLATLVLASVAYSQSIADEQAMLPSCSLTCLQNAITGAGCSVSDYNCQCVTQKNAITTAATPCIIGACTTNDALKIQGITNAICSIAAAQPASSGAASAVSSATSIASSMVSSATSAASSAASSVMSSMSNAASSATSKASSAAAGSATTSSGTAIQTTNAGSKKEAFGVVGAAAMLAAFAL